MSNKEEELFINRSVFKFGVCLEELASGLSCVCEMLFLALGFQSNWDCIRPLNILFIYLVI